MACKYCGIKKNQANRKYFYKSRYSQCKGCWIAIYKGKGHIGQLLEIQQPKSTVTLEPIKAKPSRKYIHGHDPSGRDRTRELVRVRDNHQCQTCGKMWQQKERRFDVHHLNGLCGKKSKKYDRVSEIGNMITLCHKCHYHHLEHSLVAAGRYRA